jgi:hypothetical protein
MKWEDNYNRQPGPWGMGSRGPGGPLNDELERDIEAHASHYAELHPDPRARTGLASILRRAAGRLRGTRDSDRPQAATSSEDVWAREEALYRAKNEGEPHA